MNPASSEPINPGRHDAGVLASDVNVETLVRRLARQVRQQPHAVRGLDADPEDVLLDVQVESVRCLLLRVRALGARAEAALSPREQEIARMVAKGFPNKTIASVLDISSWTVGTHLRRIFAKVGVSSRAAMVARLLEGGSLD